ncbi:S8 family serine peptidase [Cloacibacterium sp.]|uniref:S8 family serine peptidase n=1 Tax=Cloacibacterium sp. TaxID=1913682 RepID=UPI0039E48B92
MKHFYNRLLVVTFSMMLTNFNAQKIDTLKINKALKEQEYSFKNKIHEFSNIQQRNIQLLKSKGYKEYIEKRGNISQLIDADENGNPLYYTTLNAEAAKMTKANTLYTANSQRQSLTGAGMVIGQWDFSKPRTTHELLSGKITYPSNQNQTISRHSTNISGTLVGNNGDSNARGISYDSKLRAYDWVNDVTEMLSEAYDPISNTNGILVANNSYGFDPIYLQSYQFGKYNSTAQNWDNLMYVKPYFQIVKAAGNARGLSPDVLPQLNTSGGYDLLEGAGISKNVLVIGSAKKNTSMSTDENYDVSDFSSYGPTDDGRIKPDFCAPGEDIYSSIDTYDQAYGTYKGSSSAAAVVSGIISLLQQYWKSVSPNSAYMWSSTVRALLAHTANDKGPEGPDYIYGWGLVDAQRASQAIHDNIEGSYDGLKKTTLIQEKTLSQGTEYSIYVVPLSSTQPLSATISWTDPQGVLDSNLQANISTPNIINDLDLKIVKINSNGTEEIFYPWKLGGINSVNSPAIKGINNVDNIERVDIKNPDVNATYKIVISPKNKQVLLKPSGFQNFSVLVSNINFCYKDDLSLIGTSSDITSSTTNKILKGKIITASNIIKNPVQGVEYVASEYITLQPGFQVEAGAGFRAYLTPCFSNTSTMNYRAQVRTNIVETSPILNDEMSNLIIIYPNPAKEEVNVIFKVNQPSFVKISLYDSSGKQIFMNSSSENFPKGNFTKSINTSILPTGVYQVLVETNEYKETKKLIIK